MVRKGRRGEESGGERILKARVDIGIKSF